MNSYGGRIPKGSKVNSGCSYRSGKSEYSSNVFSESDIDSMNRDELIEIAKILGVSSSIIIFEIKDVLLNGV